MPLQSKTVVPGFLRLRQIIAPHGPLPISRSTWWAGVKSGRFPAPVKLGPRTTAWRIEDILRLIRELGEQRNTGPKQPSVNQPV